MRQQSQQPRAPAAIERAELAIELAQGLAALRLGLGRDQIGDRFGLGQIELAVQKGAAGEFAGLGEAQPHARQRRDHRRDDRAAAMDVKFGDILAGNAARRRETTARARHRCRSPLSGSRSRTWRARRGGGRLPASAASASPARGPVTRTIAIAALPRRGRRGEDRVGESGRRRRHHHASAAADPAAASAARPDRRS